MIKAKLNSGQKENENGGIYDTLGVDLRADYPKLEVPVYFFQGRHDSNALSFLVEAYFAHERHFFSSGWHKKELPKKWKLFQTQYRRKKLFPYAGISRQIQRSGLNLFQLFSSLANASFHIQLKKCSRFNLKYR